MPKKRKSEYSGLDEVEKTLHTSFCTAANSISHLYTQAQQQQKQSFHAGERHAVEKLYFWLLREHQAGSNISVGQILGYLQNELEGVSGDDTAMSPGPQSAQQQQQAVAIAAGSVGTSRPGQIETPAAPLDQSKNSVFTGTLTSPIRQDLPAFSMTPSGYGLTNNSGHPGRRTGVGLEQHANLGWEEDQGVAPYHDASATAGLGFHPTQQQQQGGDGHSFGANDASMDMHGGGVGDGYFH
ncbi:hypothetical protein CY35_16G024700 [Sphagnum magellanicum]|nr:hypothetical protein CY35_16G024700 [Sphagnum magellanicum]KAH9536928.1 hypothetical protein CY35_16G024700 [Sphagnum magellanicum]